MTYAPDQVAEIEREYVLIRTALVDLIGNLLTMWDPKLTQARAKEYLRHGLCRRLKTLRRCLEQVFTVCPPGRTMLLEREEQEDLTIALQAFMINVYGALDNLAWVLVHEAALSISRMKVNLLKDEVRALLRPEADAYLQDPKSKRWYANHMVNFRDALAHRIPLYVPPSAMTRADIQKYQDLQQEMDAAVAAGEIDRADELLDQQAQLGTLQPAYVHSFDDPGAAPATLFHPQMIIDLKTLRAITLSVSGT